MQQIYVRVDNSQNNDCVGVVPLVTLEVNPVPVANPVNDLEICDNADDGSSDNGIVQSFNLDAQTPLILGSQSATDYTVTYHISASEASTGVNAIASTTAYTNITPNLQTIYVRVINNVDGCFTYHTSFDLIVNDIPTANPIEDLEVCDDDLDGFAIFDLSSKDDDITNGQVDVTVSHHASFADATSGSNPLMSPYTNTVAGTQIIYARVEDINTGCINTNINFNIVAKDCTDSDNDSVPNVDEDLNNNGNLDDDDTDGDMIPNYQDDDDDGDGVLTINEDYNNNGDVTDDDINNNGIPDYLDDEATLSTSELEKVDFTLYPNPAKNLISFRFIDNTIAKAEVIIYDVRGRVISKSDSNVENGNATTDISNISNGVYFVKIIANEKSCLKRLIVGTE
jgi:hypothetical protein